MTDRSPVAQEDFDALLELLDRDTMRDVIRLFVESVPARLETVAQGIASADTAAIATAFHTMRSGCGQLGAHPLEEVCFVAERAAKSGDLSSAAGYLQQARAEYDALLAWFRAHHWVSTS